MSRKRKIGMANDAMGLVATGAVLGVGGSLPGAGPGAAAFGSMMPVIGTTIGGGYAIRATMNMIPKKRR